MSFRKNERQNEGHNEESESKPTTSKRVCTEGVRRPGRPPKVPAVNIDQSGKKKAEEKRESTDVSSGSGDSAKHKAPVIFKAGSSYDIVPVTLLQEAEDSSTLPKENVNPNDNGGQNVLFLTPVFTNSIEVSSIQEASNANANSDDNKVDVNATPQIAEVFSIATQNMGPDQPQLPGDLSTQILQSNDYQIQYTIEGAEPIILSRVPFPPPPMGLQTEASGQIDTSGVNLTQSPSTTGKRV